MKKKILILGATGNLGQEITKKALEIGCEITVLVRNLEKMGPEIDPRIEPVQADLASIKISELSEQMALVDAVICVAGNVDDGENFVALLEKVISAGEALPPKTAPIFWFMAGAAILNFPDSHRRGTDIPLVPAKYRFHLRNFARLENSNLDWRLCCPGPMVKDTAIGLKNMRVSVEVLPIAFPALIQKAPAILSFPFFAGAISEITVPYDDVAELILSNLDRGGSMSCRRIGIALPLGMRKHKK